MNSTERVRRTITGQDADRQPIYGWVGANHIDERLAERYGSVAAFEDKYEFDAAHIFGGPDPYDTPELKKLRDAGEEITPEIMLDLPHRDVNQAADYENAKKAIEFHKQRDRFCYVQTPGFFELFNGYMGIENQLCYLAMYNDEIKELYTRQVEWTKRFAENMVDLGADMVHISDDWGAQNSLMFSPRMWQDMIFPNMKNLVEHIHRLGVFASLHSDGCIRQVTDGLVDVGIDVVHPWQESAGMSYDTYLEKYQNKFGLLGGVCIQTTLGFGNYDRLEKEIRRVFGLLRHKRWIVCTTHFVQEHCSLDELVFAYDLIYKLARE